MANIDELVCEAETLLYNGIEKEAAELSDASYPIIINPEKYKKLQNMYEQILQLDPDNEKALKGIQICNDMLQPYIPVQHLAGGPLDMSIQEDFTHFQETIQSKSVNTTTLKPWEIRRKILDSFIESDNAGIKYTQQVFSESAEEANVKVREIISHAKLKAAKENKNPFKICREAIITLTQFQDQLHQGWKGHGPEIIHSAAETLLKELCIAKEVKNKIETIKSHISDPDNEIHKAVGLDEIDEFITIFSYINPELSNFKNWIDEIAAIYPSLVFKITISSYGAYTIDPEFPSHLEKEAADVFPRIRDFTMQKTINTDDFVDLIFLTWVWDTYFYTIS